MAITTTCNFCNLPLDPGDDAPRTFTEDLGGNWQIAGYTNAAGCEHYREESAADGHAEASEWWASLGDLREAITDAAEVCTHLNASPDETGHCSRCGRQWPTYGPERLPFP